MSSSEENTFLTSLTQDHTWLGGNDVVTEGTYSWTGGTSWSFDSWRSNAPNNGNGNSEQDCVILRTDGEWDDVSCSTSRNFLCQKPAAGQSALAANTACSCGSDWTASYDTGSCYKRGEAAASRHLATMAAPHPALAALFLGLATSGVQAIGADILTELISFPLRSNPFFAKVPKISNMISRN